VNNKKQYRIRNVQKLLGAVIIIIACACGCSSIDRAHELIEMGKPNQAMNELYNVEVGDSDYDEAQEMLERIADQSEFYVEHTPTEDENLSSIAELYYGDDDYSELLMNYNALDSTASSYATSCGCWPGSIINISVVDLEEVAGRDEPLKIPLYPVGDDELLALAETLKAEGNRLLDEDMLFLAKERFIAAIECDAEVQLASENVPALVIEEVRKHKSRRRLSTAAKTKVSTRNHTQELAQAETDLGAGRLLQAAKRLNGIKSAKADKLRGKIETARKKKAEELYKQGLNAFRQDDLEGAIAKWKKVIEYQPRHDKAKRDIARAQQMLKKLRKFQ
jgi:tetratricopeptide (TPR) repeat protein